jgi:hypothetical protein
MKTNQNSVNNLNKTMFVNFSKFALGLTLCIGLTLTSCKKDNDLPTPDGVALTEFFETNRGESLQTFTLNPTTGGVITGSEGTKVVFPPNAIGLNGNPVTGNVTIQLIELYDRSGMLSLNMPTYGSKPNGDHEVLKSGGEFFLNAVQGSNQLELLIPAEIRSRGVNPADFENFQVFRAGNDIKDNDLWKEADEDGDGNTDDAQGRDGQGTAGGFVMYNAFDTSAFGWTNLDRWYNYTGATTQLYIDVPAGYDGDNCSVYLTYDGEPTALARMDIYDANTELFTEHYGRIPVGQAVHFILVAEIGGVLHYTIQDATIVNGHTEIMATPQPTTQSQLETLIDALP